MADVLSQSQIDALLKSMQSDGPEKMEQSVEKKLEAEETKYSKYDFYKKVYKGQNKNTEQRL